MFDRQRGCQEGSGRRNEAAASEVEQVESWFSATSAEFPAHFFHSGIDVSIEICVFGARVCPQLSAGTRSPFCRLDSHVVGAAATQKYKSDSGDINVENLYKICKQDCFYPPSSSDTLTQIWRTCSESYTLVLNTYCLNITKLGLLSLSM